MNFLANLFKVRLAVLIVAIFISKDAFALFELSGEFGYKTQAYGSARENDITERTYSSSLAMYLFETTALEVNYSYSTSITNEHNRIAVTGTTVNIIGMVNTVESEVFGLGLRQLFASRKSVLRPMLSMGYAKQFVVDYTDITIEDSTGAVAELRTAQSRSKSDSVFASFSLELRLIKHMALRGSVQTVFPAFEFDKMKDYQKYTAGFTWIF